MALFSGVINRTTEPVVERSPRELIMGGAISGAISGVVMIALMCLATFAFSQGFGTPLRAIAAVFLGEIAMIGGFGTLLLGFATHMFVAASLGVLFAYSTSQVSNARTAALSGLVFGVAVWLVMTYIVLPAIDPVMRERVALLAGTWFALHLVYGGVLGITPAVEDATVRGDAVARRIGRLAEERTTYRDHIVQGGPL